MVHQVSINEVWLASALRAAITVKPHDTQEYPYSLFRVPLYKYNECGELRQVCNDVARHLCVSCGHWCDSTWLACSSFLLSVVVNERDLPNLYTLEHYWDVYSEMPQGREMETWDGFRVTLDQENCVVMISQYVFSWNEWVSGYWLEMLENLESERSSIEEGRSQEYSLLNEQLSALKQLPEAERYTKSISRVQTLIDKVSQCTVENEDTTELELDR